MTEVWTMSDERRRLGRMVAPTVAAAILLAACGTGSKAYGGGGTGSGASTVATRSVPGLGGVLASRAGFTLYHLTTEVNGSIQCTGGCASTWPPLLAPGGKAPAPPAGVTGTFATVKRPDGAVQVTFDGMPLYTYSGDSGPQQANGQGIGGVWFAVTSAAQGASGSPNPAGKYPGY